MKNKIYSNTLHAACFGLVLAASTTSSVMAEGIEANVALTSDYYFRGISQTNNDPAIQGGFDWSHESGVYVGAWGSNVSFGDTNLEVDTYAGFSNEVSGIGYDLGLILYNYNATDSNSDPLELYVGLSYDFLSAGYAYSSNWFGSDLASNYIYLSAEYGISDAVTLAASIGYSYGDTYGISEYMDYKVGVSGDLAGVTLDLSYVGNDLSDAQCGNYGYSLKQCDSRLILTMSKSF